MLHNARRARVPIVNIVGDQATYHAPLDPPLSTDTEGLARPVSAWVRRVTRTESLGADAAAAVQAARRPPSGIATLILPSDVSWNEGGVDWRAAAGPRTGEGFTRDRSGHRARARLARAHADAARGRRGVEGRARAGASDCSGHWRAARCADLQHEARARARPLSDRARSLHRRRGRGEVCRHQASDPRRRGRAGDVLRLSGKAEHRHAEGRQGSRAGAARRRSRRCAGAAGRRAELPGGGAARRTTSRPWRAAASRPTALPPRSPR